MRKYKIFRNTAVVFFVVAFVLAMADNYWGWAFIPALIGVGFFILSVFAFPESEEVNV